MKKSNSSFFLSCKNKDKKQGSGYPKKSRRDLDDRYQVLFFIARTTWGGKINTIQVL